MILTIRNHRFNINCDEKDAAAMRATAAQLDKQLERVRKQYGVSDSERSALIAGLMVAFEAKKAHNGNELAIEFQQDQMQGAISRIDEILKRTDFSAEA